MDTFKDKLDLDLIASGGRAAMAGVDGVRFSPGPSRTGRSTIAWPRRAARASCRRAYP